MGQVIILLFLQRRHLGFGEHQTVFGDLFLQGTQTSFKTGQVMA
jgi:hypothetical protein